MPQTYIDEDALKKLKEVQNSMKKEGISGATLGDAVRRMYNKVVSETGNPFEAPVFA